jgi:hypothetical protein
MSEIPNAWTVWWDYNHEAIVSGELLTWFKENVKGKSFIVSQEGELGMLKRLPLIVVSPGEDKWESKHKAGLTLVCFETKEEALMFKLTWSGQ